MYHLVPGTWTADALGTGPNHSILSTELTGHQLTFLEGDRPQVIACGIPASNGINIYNQALQTVVLSTNTYQSFTIHTINHVISFPGAYSSEMSTLGVDQFVNLQQSAGVSNSSLDSAHGFTIFVFTDTAFQNSVSNVSTASPQALFNNHVSIDTPNLEPTAKLAHLVIRS